MNIRYRLATIIIALLALAFHANAVAPKAADIMQKAASSLLKSGGITATYTLKAGTHTQGGAINVKGKKFSVITKEISTWYDGLTMWNYNSSDNEVTISTPTAADVASMNPYALVSSYKSEYNVRLVSGNIKGTYNIQLTPKNSKNPVKSAVLCLRASNYQPVRLDVTARNGAKTVIIVTNIKTGVSLSDASFKFPSSKYPKAQVVDLR